MRAVPVLVSGVVVAAVAIAAVAPRSGVAGPCIHVAGEHPLWLHVARIFDGERVVDGQDVLIADGKIAAVGTIACVDAHGGQVEKIDAANATLLPGLIDAHTHGSDRERNLADAIAFGVTTEIDMGGAMAASLDAIRAKDNPLLADAIGAGMYVTAPGGHGTEYGGDPVPTLGRAEDADAFVAARVAERSPFIKLIISSGMPKLNGEEARAVTLASHARGRLVVTHVDTRADAEVAVEAGVDGLAHLFNDRKNGHLRDGSPIGWDAEAARRLVARMAERHVFVIPTLQMMQLSCGIATGRPLLGDARIAVKLDDGRRAKLDTEAWGKKTAHPDCYAHVVETMTMLHGSVDILAGTDAPNDGAIHGASMHRELELLVESALSPPEALRAATSAPARAFASLNDRGRVVAGARADLLLVEGDPTSDILATRNVLRVYKGGKLSWPRP
jgi:imidazolonepropionase-like amidohydrolase